MVEAVDLAEAAAAARLVSCQLAAAADQHRRCRAAYDGIG